MSAKIQKILAAQGLASRRKIEDWIKDGRITINDHKATIGMRLESSDRIKIDGKRLRMQSYPTEWLVYHKAEGEITSRRDPQQRATVFQNLSKPRHGRWVAVGRLDINSSGLLLFTNNGDCANYLMHPANEIKRVYRARVPGRLNQQQLQRLCQGIDVGEYTAHFEQVEFAGGGAKNCYYRVSLMEGKNREVRRLFAALGYQVGRLQRIQYGGINLPKDLARGQFRSITSQRFPFLKRVELECQHQGTGS